jgi:hypothetical protein
VAVSVLTVLARRLVQYVDLIQILSEQYAAPPAQMASYECVLSSADMSSSRHLSLLTLVYPVSLLQAR